MMINGKLKKIITMRHSTVKNSNLMESMEQKGLHLKQSLFIRNIMVISYVAIGMVLGFSFGRMDLNIKENLKMIKDMDMVMRFRLQERGIQGNTKKAKEMDIIVSTALVI